MTIDRLLTSLHSTRPVAGLTHNFYRYPARMSPELAHEVIHLFSHQNDIVLDPFMGGGTSIVEAVAAGRQAVGIDLNPLAAFVTGAKTTPLSANDEQQIRRWASSLDFTTKNRATWSVDKQEVRAKNLPLPMRRTFAQALRSVLDLSLPRQQRFARCALLRLGQWAVDCKIQLPKPRDVKEKLNIFVDEMFGGLAEYVASAQGQGIAKNKLTRQRTLLLRSAVDVHHDSRMRDIIGKPKLVLTSPPYPGVHVLYHRWQVEGRRETPAPYWLIGAQDGNGASYYTLGSRSVLGLQNYFRDITAVFKSMRAIIHPDALVVQLVAFSDTETQLPAFLEAMKQAGFDEDNPADYTDLWRIVPHRKWYNYLSTARSSGQELLLLHRPRPGVATT